MRLALLVTDLERGGTPLRLLRLSKALQTLGVDVHLGCLAPDGPIARAARAAGLSTFACDATSLLDFGTFQRLIRHFRKIAPDLVHASLTHANVAARLIAPRLGIPVVGSTATIEIERRWHRWAERLTIGREQLHIVNSESVAAHVQNAFGLARARIRIVPPCIDPPGQHTDQSEARRQLGLPAECRVALWCGRLDRVKRVDLLISAAAQLADQRWHLLIAGEGPERDSLQRQVNDLALANVHLLGWRDDRHLLLSAADLFVFPSRTEGMPNAVLEALAFGIPVIASDIPALREIGDDGPRLSLIPGDRPDEWAAAMRTLYDDAATRASLGSAGRNWARHLTPQHCAQATLTVYQEVLSP